MVYNARVMSGICLIVLIAALPLAGFAQNASVAEYTAQQTKCYEISEKVLAGSGEAAMAEKECKKAFDLANKLSAANTSEKITAYHGYGWTLLYQQRFAEALTVWATELDLALKAKPQDRKAIALAYFDVGRATQGTGDLRLAEWNYLKAELIYIELHRSAGTRALKEELKADIIRNLLVRKYLAMAQDDNAKYNKIAKHIEVLQRSH